MSIDQLKVSQLSCDMINVGYDGSYKVLSYSVIAMRDTTMIFFMDVSGSKFTADLQKKFDLLQTNDRVIFTNIETQLLNDQKATLNSIEILIK